MTTLKDEHRVIAKGTFWSMAGTMALKLVSFIYTILIARLFTQDDVGTFYLALSIIYTISVFSDFGLFSAFGRYVPYYMGRKEKDKAYVLLQTSYIYAGGLSLLLAVVTFFASGFLAGLFKTPALAPAIEFLALYLVVGNLFALSTGFLVGLKKIKENNLIQNAQNLLKLVLTLALFFIVGPSAFILSFAFTASFLIMMIFSLWYANRAVDEAGIPRSASTFKTQWEMLVETAPFGLMLVMVSTFWVIATYADRMLLGYLLPPETATAGIAVYSMALSLAALIAIFPGAVISIFLPMISEIQGAGKKETAMQISNSTVRWVTFLMVPITILLIAFPADILQMFYGTAYATGATVLVLFAVGTFIRSLSYPHGTILASMRVVKVELLAAIVAMAVNVALNWILIPIYGIEGSAFAAAVSFLVVTILIVYYCKKIAGFGFPLGFFKPIGAGILALALLLLIKPWVLQAISLAPLLALGESMAALVFQKLVKLAILGLLFAFAAGIYFAVLVMMKAFEPEDKELMSAALRRGKVPDAWVVSVQNFMGGSDV
jgi:O-antigen/teichoic acid export membrane protein